MSQIASFSLLLPVEDNEAIKRKKIYKYKSKQNEQFTTKTHTRNKEKKKNSRYENAQQTELKPKEEARESIDIFNFIQFSVFFTSQSYANKMK